MGRDKTSSRPGELAGIRYKEVTRAVMGSIPPHAPASSGLFTPILSVLWWNPRTVFYIQLLLFAALHLSSSV